MRLGDVAPTLDKLPRTCQRRVLYGEVDRMDVVYGSHYLTWFENGRNEYLRLCGLPYTEIEERGLILPVIESHVWHTGAVHYDELIDVRCAITACTKVTATFLLSLERDGERVAAGYTQHACLDAGRRPVRLPDWLRDATFQRYDVGI